MFRAPSGRLEWIAYRDNSDDEVRKCKSKWEKSGQYSIATTDWMAVWKTDAFRRVYSTTTPPVSESSTPRLDRCRRPQLKTSGQLTPKATRNTPLIAPLSPFMCMETLLGILLAFSFIFTSFVYDI